jgi:hypothetical protein
LQVDAIEIAAAFWSLPAGVIPANGAPAMKYSLYNFFPKLLIVSSHLPSVAGSVVVHLAPQAMSVTDEAKSLFDASFLSAAWLPNSKEAVRLLDVSVPLIVVFQVLQW